jgi:hypothetical protein
VTAGETAAAIGVPLFVFAVTAIYGGIKLMLRASQYMTRSATAQEATAKSSDELNQTLKAYMARNDDRVNDHERRIFLLEDVRRQNEKDRG